MMESLRPILWEQGMFLRPQHFQQHDYYQEARLQSFMHLISPFCWGVKTLSINEIQLRNFVFEVDRCELVTQEGTIIRIGHEYTPSNARIEPRSFERTMDPGGKPLGVYLGFKRLQWEESNIGPQNGSEGDPGATADWSRRYSLVREDSIRDLFAVDSRSCSLKYLIYQVQTLFEEEALNAQDHELVKVAELLRSPSGQGAILSTRYVAPSLSIHSSPVLEVKLREIRDLLTAKGRTLAEHRYGPETFRTGTGSRDVTYLLMMMVVNRYIALFRHYFDLEEMHPCPFYALLRELVGELSAFSKTASTLDELHRLPPYDHRRLWECFSAILEMAKQLLNELGEVEELPYTAVPLIFRERYFTADLNQEFLAVGKEYYLLIKLDISPADLVERLRRAKISCREDISWLIDKAVPGLEIDRLTSPPDMFPRHPHFHYFKLKRDTTPDHPLSDHQLKLWKNFKDNRNLALYSQPMPQETEIQLLAMGEK